VAGQKTNLTRQPHPRSLYAWACAIELCASCNDVGEQLSRWSLYFALLARVKALDARAALALGRLFGRQSSEDPFAHLAKAHLRAGGVSEELLCGPEGDKVVSCMAEHLRSARLAETALWGGLLDHEVSLVQFAPGAEGPWRISRDVAIDVIAGAYFFNAGSREAAADMLNRGVPAKDEGLRSDHVRNAFAAWEKLRLRGIAGEVGAGHLAYEAAARFGAAKILWERTENVRGSNPWPYFCQIAHSGDLLKSREAAIDELEAKYSAELCRRINAADTEQLKAFARVLKAELRRRARAA